MDTQTQDSPTYTLSFEQAMALMRRGYVVRRLGWAQSLYIVPGSQFNVNRAPLMGILPEGTPIEYQAHIDFRRPDGVCGVWNPQHEDLFAEDWGQVPPVQTTTPTGFDAHRGMGDRLP